MSFCLSTNYDVDASELATLKLEEHVNSVTSFHVIVRDVLLVSQRFSSVDQTDHGHIDSLFLLQSLLDLQNGVCGLEVERLLHSSECLYKGRELVGPFYEEAMSIVILFFAPRIPC